MGQTKPSNMRLDDETLKLIQLLTEHLGLNQTSIVKLAVRELARKEGLMTLELTFHTDEDRKQFLTDGSIPEYFSEETKQAIQSQEWRHKWEVFIPPHARQYAEENQNYPVTLQM